MANEPENMIIPLLREMRGEIRERFSVLNDQFSEIKGRLDKLESGQKTIRQALTADTMMSKFVTGDFEERIFELERKVEALTKGK
jgi:tetrahydromethanopterin S-methyltransferase subunit G